MDYYSWNYREEQYYQSIKDADVVGIFLGTYITTVTIIKTDENTFKLQFVVHNTSSWESVIRFRREQALANGKKTHPGIIPNSKRGKGYQVGGNLNQTWTWEEPLNSK